MSGLASVVFTLWVTFFTPDAALNKWVLIVLSVIFFIVGSYHIWANEYRTLLAERTVPEIKGRIEEDFIYVGPTEKQLTITYIPIVVMLVNHRQVEAGLDRFELTVLIDGKEHKARNVPAEGIELKRPEFDQLGLRTSLEGVKERYKDLLTHRYEPLRRGIPQYGWLLFVLSDTIIHPSTDCTLRLTVVDVFGNSHPLPDAKKTTKRSGTVAIPKVIDRNDRGPINARATEATINEGIVTLIMEGTALLADCEKLTGATPPAEIQKKIELWVSSVEEFLRKHRSEKYVTLFHSEAGVPEALGAFGETAQAKLCHFLRSRLKNLKVLSIPGIGNIGKIR
jgi:hypothetical protein